MPKCIELNSKSKLKSILVLGVDVTQDPNPIYSFFGWNVCSHVKIQNFCGIKSKF